MMSDVNQEIADKLSEAAELLDNFSYAVTSPKTIIFSTTEIMRLASNIITAQEAEIKELKQKMYLYENPDCEENLEAFRRSGRKAALEIDYFPGWPAGCTSAQGEAWQESYDVAIIEKKRLKKLYHKNISVGDYDR